jgi:hypothetical protein
MSRIVRAAMDCSPRHAHERASFFKYMTASTARIVVSSMTLRWSSPLRFNDPFDTPRELAFGVAPVDVTKALARRLADLVQSPPPDTTGLSPEVRLIVEAARRAAPDARAEIVSVMKAGFAGQQPSGEPLEDLRALWRGFIPDFRILCLTEDPASASMWHNYADAMKGAVIEFACVDDFDSPWLSARPVTYVTRAEDMFSASELAEILLMPQRKQEETILDWGTFRKSPEWSNEREWRVVSSKRATGVGDYTDYPFHAPELSTVFLGPRMALEDREALITEARRYPRARVVQVAIGKGQGFQFRDVLAR